MQYTAQRTRIYYALFPPPPPMPTIYQGATRDVNNIKLSPTGVRMAVVVDVK
jgi:hypothetical protein